MKKTNEKGFTLVELVIVIAVIAILAGVLIGTFASVISRANQSKAVQEWKAAIDASYVEYVADFHNVPTTVKIDGKGSIVFGDGEVSSDDKSFDAKSLSESGSIQLEPGVFFNWKYDAVNSAESGYTISTSAEGNELSQSGTKSYMQDAVDKAWNAINDERISVSVALSGDEFYSLSFKTTVADTGEYTITGGYVTLGKHNGKTYYLIFTSTTEYTVSTDKGDATALTVQ